MANMSYCRFRNTYSDLDDCVDALRELPELTELDIEERAAAKRMRELCEQYIEEYDNLN